MLPVLVGPPVVRIASVNDATGNVMDIYCLGLFGPSCHVVCKSLDIDFTANRDGAAINRILQGFYGVKFNAGDELNEKSFNFVLPLAE